MYGKYEDYKAVFLLLSNKILLFCFGWTFIGPSQKYSLFTSHAHLILSNKITILVNVWKIIYFNFGERYEDEIDHHSYTHNVSNCEIKAWKKKRAWRKYEPMPLSYYPISQCSALPDELSSQLGAGHIVNS